MKKLFKKSRYIGIAIISLMLIVTIMNYWIMSLKLTQPYSDDNLWSLAGNPYYGNYLNLFAFILMLIFYISIIPILLSLISLFRKNSRGFMIAALYFLGFGTALIVFQSFNHYLSNFTLILTLINIIVIMGIFILMILRNKMLIQVKNLQINNTGIKLSNTKIPRYVLIIDIASIIVFLSTFMIPLYTVVESGLTYNAILIHVLLLSDTHLVSIIYFVFDFVIFLSIFIYFANSLSHYFADKEGFINQSKTLVTFTFVGTLLFFMTGLAMNIYYTLNDNTAQTIAYIPLLMMIIWIIVYSIFRGKYTTNYQISNKGNKLKFAKIESLFYIILLTTVSVLMLLLPIIKINISAGTYRNIVNLTGFRILRDYATLNQGYRMVAYILVVMLISVGLSLVVALSSYISKYSRFYSIVKSVTAVNVFFVFIIAISGYYFQIANQINQAVIKDIVSHYGIDLPNGLDYTYTISTDTIYALIASVFILILMFIRKGFDRDNNMNLVVGDPYSINNASPSSGNSSSVQDDEVNQPFDPCPSFAELDSEVDAFKQDLNQRKTLRTKTTTLSELVNFIVDYAKNSRLHLSYTPKDIATFVAGLGASRLSILQGMSGTGKTSLPKIFSEAIFGNCEIIEVESSWKDKNELLGYYNEFSMKYTPKKFTLALYKAALNQDICTFILLDEMNLSRIEYYFSDFLSLMENEENQREIKLVNIKLARKVEDKETTDYLALTNGNTLKVPPNVWFIGTANRDESTFVISDKVYDRAHTMNFTKRAPKVRNYSDPISQQYYDYQTVNDLLVEAKQNGDFDAEKSEFIKNVEKLLAPYNISFGNRILKQIEDFVNIYKACFANEDVESEAIEKILLSKVVAKLEVKVIENKEKLEFEFEKLNLNQCLEFVKRLDCE